MSVNPFVRALGLIGFAEFAIMQGLNPVQMLRLAELPQDSLQHPEGIFAFRRYCALLDICQRHSGNPLFGLQFGGFQGLDVFGELLYLIRNARTVGDALGELRGNYALYDGAADIGLDSDGDTTILSYRVGELDPRSGALRFSHRQQTASLRLDQAPCARRCSWRARVIASHRDAAENPSTGSV